MSANCHSHQQFDGTSQRYKNVLWTVIGINITMFFVEMVYGVVGDSQALKADALDFLGDSATYALSLWAVHQSPLARSNVALIKGWSLLAMACFVLGSTIYYVLVKSHPSAPIMGWVAFAALIANVVSVVLLIRFREGDANVRSVWLCSRNDAIGNVGVLCAAFLVFLSGTRWPDLLVAIILAGLFTSSAIQIIRQASAEKLAVVE